MLEGFKKFIMRGNVLDMAIGIIIGGAFTPIVTALTEKILMPLIAGLFGKPNFDNIWTITVGGGQVMPGYLLTAIINFLLIAAAIYFAIVAPMNAWAEHKAAKEAPAPEPVAPDVELLTEIRDLLSQQSRQ
ncbi:MAG: large conductance mechanosensitive channel protein MscL [Ancrocorticia sp.]|jgi:large conductance mechanosensitive channel|nr:large conductance mechanosensitive channel protein MscL [Ancrocorticia sp.]MCI1932894.1 large conductance mechanosensitive channel protein MscL [Ancrocorticia sp.]MCI1963583.1 large conductance mechanosensitive channel protein MscL [Ancrocorticia sp.]MCI2002666.1 large conductance mechanosensitive channel protein MscL [Ancrocorticia sp.]MCI2013104.1 large conductance mechanosensitive channel protein MscL [Ancrocorticia sp.]